MNSVNFDYDQCDFSSNIMTTKDKLGQSRAGSGRVGIYKATGIPHCYTLECHTMTGHRVNYLKPQIDMTTGKEVKDESPLTNAKSAMYCGKSPTFTDRIYEDVGRAVAVAFLDYI